MALENLKSIFHDQLVFQSETYEINRPDDGFDTKLNYNENPLVPQSYGIDISTQTRSGRVNPILDSVLRGRIYEPIQFSQNFTNTNLFIGPEQSPFTDLKDLFPFFPEKHQHVPLCLGSCTHPQSFWNFLSSNISLAKIEPLKKINPTTNKIFFIEIT